MSKQKSQNIILQLGLKYVKGLISVDFSINPEFEETLCKADNGIKQSEFTGYTSELSAELYCDSLETEDGTAKLSFLELRAAAKAGTIFDIIYGDVDNQDGGDIEDGKAVISSWSEKAPASGVFSASVSLKVQGSLSAGTAP